MCNKFTRMKSTRDATLLYTMKVPRSKNTENFYFGHVYTMVIENRKEKKNCICLLNSNTLLLHVRCFFIFLW